MRPPTRSTRSIRQSENLPPQSAIPRPSTTKTPRPSSTRSSRTGTPFSEKEKKTRHRMTDLQLERLEALYQQDTHPSREEKQALGDEVGMNTRTVTIWFQNRRQLAKKNSQLVASTPQLMSRQPLSTVHHSNIQLSRQSSVVSTLSQSSRSGYATPPVSRRELWEYLPSSPSSSSLVASAVTSAMPSPLARKFSKLLPAREQGSDSKKRRPLLEWACAQVSKRQRTEPGDDDLDEESDRTMVDPNSVELKTGKAKAIPEDLPVSASLTAFAIPPEYNAKFDPDVVLGASLLLTFQYASDR